MLITKLVLNNYRVFRGRHEIDLRPKPTLSTKGEVIKDGNIILLGGLNGAGKTSILTAVRFALYGRQSVSSALTNADYINALDGFIHKNGSASDALNDASVELEFLYSQSGKESRYMVVRELSRGKIDKLALYKDDTLLNELNYEQCQGFLNELIPIGVADLFFFDGEKIAELAEDDTGAILKVAVQRLLGLDIIDKLKSDLIIHLKKQGNSALSGAIKKEIEKLDENLVKHKLKAEALRNEADFVDGEINHATRQISKLEEKLSQQGGAWAKTREEEKSRVDELLKEKIELEKLLRTEMESCLPFQLAPQTITSLLALIKKEQVAKQKQSFGNELNQFLDILRVKLDTRLTVSAPAAMIAIEESLTEHVGDAHHDGLLLDISDKQANTIEYQVNTLSVDSFSRFDEARKRLAVVNEAIDNASINIARAPEQDLVQKFFNEIRELDKKKEKLIIKYHDLLEEAKREIRAVIDTTRLIQKKHNEHREKTTLNHGVENAENTILLLSEFSKKLTNLRVQQLEREFTASYERLARKENQSLSTKINPTTFDVELIDGNGFPINRKSMSAGEKQIYAIAILEALGKTSGKKLPIIIDTPLGRLDSHHRDKLVENYFPNASEQVVILSTDTEIDNAYFDLIQDDIGMTYEIQFDEKTQSSSLYEKYFWKKKDKECA